MGRTKVKPRYNVVSFRLTDEEFALVSAQVVKGKIKRGDLVRDLVIAGVYWLQLLEAANAQQR